MPGKDAADGFISMSWSHGDSSKTHPGRGRHSKGCLTCRKRRVKCDEGRPTCQRCRNGFHVCMGYEQPLIWVNRGVASGGDSTDATTTNPPASKSVAKRKLVVGRRSADLSPLRCSSGSESESASPPSVTSTVSSLILASQSSSFGTPVSHVSPMLALDGFKDEIVISHMITKMSLGLSQTLPRGTDAPTMAAVLKARDGPSAAYVSGLGLAEAFFGRIHKLDDLVKHSAILYGQSLRQLRDDLQQVDEALVRERAYMNLWTSLFLGLYELVSSSSSSSWLEHCRGVSALTRSLGPSAFQDTVSNTMFQANMSFITIGHIVMRKHCFLADPEWQTVPWAKATEPKPISFQIQDIFCVTPGLMQELDIVIAGSERGDDMTEARFILQGRILDTIDSLAQLRWQWEEHHPNACWEVPAGVGPSVSIDEDGVPIFATTLHFREMDCAADIVYFSAIRLLLYSLSDRAGLLDDSAPQAMDFWTRQGPFSNPLLIPGQGDRIDNVLEMCRIVDYMMQGKKESFGAFILLFPLRVAYTHLTTQPTVYNWLQGILSKLTSSKGFQIGEHLTNLDSRPASPMP